MKISYSMAERDNNNDHVGTNLALIGFLVDEGNSVFVFIGLFMVIL